MKLKTEELRKFLTTAAQIKPNPVATNLDSIKIECTGQEVVFTKTNNNIWCKYSCICQLQPAEVFLINERMLNGVALTTKEYEIIINKNDEVISIVSGEDVISTKIQDLKLFPLIQDATGERIKISKEAVERIRIASKYISDAINKTAMNFVQIGIGGIFATNGSIVYYHNTFPLPEVFFDQEPLSIVKGTDDMLYWTSESYDFFQLDGFMFGFIKSVIKPITYAPIIAQTGTDFFTCKREDFIDFCTLVQYSKRQEYPRATFHTIGEIGSNGHGQTNYLSLKFADADFNINISRNITIESNALVQEFIFSVDWVGHLLKTLPYQVLTFTKVGDGHYAVTTPEDADYKGIIARLQN